MFSDLFNVPNCFVFSICLYWLAVKFLDVTLFLHVFVNVALVLLDWNVDEKEFEASLIVFLI